MRLSKLKELNPIAWEAIKAECIKQESEAEFSRHYNDDSCITVVCRWSDTLQGHEVWEQIEFKKRFTLFNKWLKKQQ